MLGRAVLILGLLGAAGCEGEGSAPSVTALSRGEHLPHFPIDRGAHEAADCNACHGEFDTFTRFTCLSCHEHAQDLVDASHAGNADYAYDSDACLRCHPTGEGMDRDVHAPYFPIAEGTPHATTGCGACHLDRTQPTDPGSFGCIDCHDHAQAPMQSAHQNPPGSAGVGSLYAWERTGCLECHAHGVVVRRPSHSARLHEGDNVAMAPHAEKATCSDCHGDRTFGTYGCGPCHDLGGEVHEKTDECDRSLGRACTDTEKYLFFYR